MELINESGTVRRAADDQLLVRHGEFTPPKPSTPSISPRAVHIILAVFIFFVVDMVAMDFVRTTAYYALYALVVRCALVYGYRFLLHPLRSYPGPFAAKFTDWYGAYHALLQHLHLVTYRNHRVYGPVFRHGPNRLIFGSAKALHDIYQNDRLFKSQAYLVTQPTPDVFSLFNVLNKTHHRAKRRIIGQGVNDKAMRDFEPLMMGHIDTFLRGLVESCRVEGGPKSVEMTDHCRYLGMDVVGQLGFGANLNLQTDKKNRFMLPGMDASNFRSNLYIQFPLLKKAGMEMFTYPFVLTNQMRYYKMIKNLILTRRSEDKHAKNDLYSFVIDLKDPDTGKGVRLRDIWAEAAFFIPAGGDTTATTLTAMFFYLSRYPSCYERLAAEIRSTFSDTKEICNGPRLNSCTYLRACINETLRITPPIPTTLWREYPKSGDAAEPLTIDGHVIPPGTEVGVNIYSIHHDEKYFPESFTFRPERWSVDDAAPQEAKDALKLMHEAFTPFSIGARGCAGKSMAYLETSLVFAKTFWYFDFEQVSGDKSFSSKGPEEFSVKDRFGALHHGPNLVFRLRENRWEELFDNV